MAIVTGFCISTADGPRAETDGPPGALALAKVAVELGIEYRLVTDEIGWPVLRAGSEFLSLDPERIVVFPTEAQGSVLEPGSQGELGSRSGSLWARQLLEGELSGLSHLVAVERVGPSHTLVSLAAQARRGPVPIEAFCLEVPVEERDVCHNMRGESIDQWTAPAHLLFEEAARLNCPPTSIGIGDGGNEIGMGRIPWEELTAAIRLGPAGRVACRVATDYTLVAGVSDWGAYALAVGWACLAGRPDAADTISGEGLRGLIETLVRGAGAVDGVTRKRQASVDGLPLETYLQIPIGIRRACGLSD
jgi:hypothetical protein